MSGPLRSVALCLGLSTLSACAPSKTPTSVNLIDDAERRHALPAPTDRLKLEDVQIAGNRKRVLFLHAPGRLVLPARELSGEARVLFDYGLLPAGFDKPGDGVTFRVRAGPPGTPGRIVFERHLSPADARDAHGWLYSSATLPSGPVQVTLETDPGPRGNTAYDWSFFADVVLEDPTPHARFRAPNIILVSLETTRPDHLKVYGGASPTAPFFSTLALTSTVYQHAYTTCTFTLPSHASVFTGQYPSQHSAVSDSESTLEGLSPGAVTLAEQLRANGYRTIGAVGAAFLSRRYGMDQGFTYYSDSFTPIKRDPAEMNRAVLSWVDRFPHGAPLFLFVNYYDAHAPYDPPGYPTADLPELQSAGIEPASFMPETFLGRPAESIPAGTLALLKRRYDAGIRRADSGFAELARGLDERGLWKDSLVCVFSDHGESFGEHGQWGHGNPFLESEARVALLLHRPEQQSGDREARPTTLASVPSLVLRAAGLRVPDSFLAYRRVSGQDSVLYGSRYTANGSFRMVLRYPFKFLLTLDVTKTAVSRGEALYDLAHDPQETTPLDDTLPALTAEFRTMFGRHAAAVNGPETRTVKNTTAPRLPEDEEAARRLRALGYIR